MFGFAVSPGRRVADHTCVSYDSRVLDHYEKVVGTLVSFDFIVGICNPGCRWDAGTLLHTSYACRLYCRVGMLGLD